MVVEAGVVAALGPTVGSAGSDGVAGKVAVAGLGICTEVVGSTGSRAGGSMARAWVVSGGVVALAQA